MRRRRRSYCGIYTVLEHCSPFLPIFPCVLFFILLLLYSSSLLLPSRSSSLYLSFYIADDGEPFTFQGIVLDIPWHLRTAKFSGTEKKKSNKEEDEEEEGEEGKGMKMKKEEGEGEGEGMKKKKEEGEEEEEDVREEGMIRPSDLTSSDYTFHQLGDPRLLKRGFLFVWVDKTIIAEVLVEFEKLGFFYVENACCEYSFSLFIFSSCLVLSCLFFLLLFLLLLLLLCF